MVLGNKFEKIKGRKRARNFRKGGSDDSSDEDYVLEEEEEEEENDFDISENDHSCSSRDLTDSKKFDFSGTSISSEDEIRSVRSKPRKHLAGQKTRRRRSRVKKTIRKARVLKKREEDEDDEEFLPGSDDEEDDEEEDYRFEDEEEEESLVVKRTWIRQKTVSHRKKGILKCRKTTKKSTISKKSSSRKRSRKLASRKREGDSDEDFVDEDRFVREVKRLKPRSRKKRSSMVVSDSDFVDSGSSDSDFEIDEDGGELVRETDDCRSLATGLRNRKKKLSTVVSDSDFVDSGSSDSDFVINEDRGELVREMENCRSSATCLRNSSLSKRCQAEDGSYRRLRRRGDLQKDDCIGMKGKEKVESLTIVDLGKQICGICLSEEQNTTIRGLLNCCNHYFCFACIMEWSKVESRCPLCKQRFVTISKSARMEMGLRKAVIRVPRCDQVYRPSDEELRGYLDPYASIVCMECHQGGDDNVMLLCDICDSAAHTYCIGLGREVPEGNWYCEGCRSADPGSSNLQHQDSAPNQATNNSNSHTEDSASGIDARDFDTSYGRPQLSINLPEQSPSMGNSTRISPRNLHEVPDTASPVSGTGASTVFGRRRLRRQIHILLSNGRLSPIVETADQTDAAMEMSGALEGSARTYEIGAQVFADIRRVRESPGTSITNVPARESVDADRRTNMPPVVSDFPRPQQRNRHIFVSDAHIAPCVYNEEVGFRKVEGAKELVRSMVITRLSRLFRDANIGRRKFKKIARNSTHTILAVCGIKHTASEVMPHQSPPNCTHIKKEEKLNLMKGCCSSCFGSFVGDVVTRCMNRKLEEDE